MILNPREITWSDPTQREDGTSFGAADLRAYELGVVNAQGAPTVLLALPVAYGVGRSPIPDALRAVTGKPQSIALRTVDSFGLTSDWTAPVEVAFVARPRAPAAFSAA